MRLWEVRTGRCVRTWDMGAAVHAVSWCPLPGAARIASACVGNKLVLLHSGLGGPEAAAAAAEALKVINLLVTPDILPRHLLPEFPPQALLQLISFHRSIQHRKMPPLRQRETSLQPGRSGWMAALRLCSGTQFGMYRGTHEGTISRRWLPVAIRRCVHVHNYKILNSTSFPMPCDPIM